MQYKVDFYTFTGSSVESKPSDAVAVIQVLNQVYMDCFLFCGHVVFQFKLFVHVFFIFSFICYLTCCLSIKIRYILQLHNFLLISFAYPQFTNALYLSSSMVTNSKPLDRYPIPWRYRHKQSTLIDKN